VTETAITKVVGWLKTVVVGRWSAFKAWRRERPAASTALLVLGIVLVLLGPVLAMTGGWSLIGHTTAKALKAYHAISDPAARIEAYGKLVSALGLMLAAPFALIGLALAFWRTWNQHRDGVLAARKLDAESFAKAVEQLGHAEISIRMGAALALEALGRASPRLLSQIIEILCAHVREKRPWSPSKGDEISGKDSAPSPSVPLPTDIQLTLEIISRLKACDHHGTIAVDLHNTDLYSVRWVEATLNEANLSKANLRRANLSKASLSKANLTEASLFKANLSEASLSEASLSEARLSGTDLRGTDLSGANLSGANLSGASLSGADLSRAKLIWAELPETNLSGTRLSGADLSGANLSGASLSGAGMSATNLNGANLSKANLDKAILSRATLRGADLSGASLSEANLGGADLGGVDLSMANLSKADLSRANLKEADLSGANLKGATLRRAIRTGTILTGTIRDPTRQQVDDDASIAPQSEDVTIARAPDHG